MVKSGEFGECGRPRLLLHDLRILRYAYGFHCSLVSFGLGGGQRLQPYQFLLHRYGNEDKTPA